MESQDIERLVNDLPGVVREQVDKITENEYAQFAIDTTKNVAYRGLALAILPAAITGVVAVNLLTQGNPGRYIGLGDASRGLGVYGFSNLEEL